MYQVPFLRPFKYHGFRWPRGWRYRSGLRPKGVLPLGLNLWLTLLLLSLLAVPALAALNPPGYTSSTAGAVTSSAKQWLPAGTDSNGNQYLTNGQTGASLRYAWYSPSQGYWYIATYLLSTSGNPTTEYWNQSTGLTPSAFPLTGWTGGGSNNGASPAPTFTANAAPSTVSSLAVSPGTLTAAGSFTATVTLSGAAPSGGASVAVTYQNSGSSSLTYSLSPSSGTYITVNAGSTQGSQSFSMTPQGSGSCSLGLTASYNNTSAAATELFNVAGPPTGAISVSPTSGAPSSSPTLSWSSTGATSVTVTGQTSPPVAGSAVVNPAATTTYTLVVTNSAGSNTYTATWTASGSSGTGTGAPAPTQGTQGAPGSPGVSASVSPFTIAPGGSAVLRWDTSGASSVVVSGVSNPSTGGTLNVSPSQTTTYTVTATNSSGTNTQQVTLTVDPSLGSGGSGVSSFMPGTTINNAGSNFTGVSLPGLTIAGSTIPGVSVPGFPTLPPLVIPGISLPPISLPGMTFPGVTAPGDLKIGIPGLGSIGIPTGWLSQLIAAAINPASIAQQLATFQSGQFNALATYNAGAAVTNAVNNGTATLQQINTTSSQQVQSAIGSTASATQSVINATSLATQNVITSVEKTAVTDFQTMLLSIMQQLFIPDPSVLNQFEQEQQQFLNWGPYSFVTSFQALLATPAGTGQLASVPLGIPNLQVNASPSDGGLQINPVTGATTYTAPMSYYTDGTVVPFDFKSTTDDPSWPAFRLFEGAAVFVLFAGGLFAILAPKQVV